MIFFAIFYLFQSTLSAKDDFVIDLTCKSTGFFLHIEQSLTEESLTWTLNDIANGGYLQKEEGQMSQPACAIRETQLNGTNSFIEQSFSYTQCGKYNQTDGTYSARLAFGLD